jgi:hypothetical protein
MTCCEPVTYRRENRYGPITSQMHAPNCPYGAGFPFRGDLTPTKSRPSLPPSISPNDAMAHWMQAPSDCTCAKCQYVEAHLDDDDDRRESIADTSDDEVGPT